MLDHFGFPVRDASKSLPFYRACLEPLGIEMVQEQPELDAAIFMQKGSPIFLWLGKSEADAPTAASGARRHLGFRAPSTAAVDAFHLAGLAHGGVDNGPPGWRRPTCYSAFVIDPDGNNIEAIWQTERPFLGDAPQPKRTVAPRQRLVAILPCADIEAAQAFFVKLQFARAASRDDYRILTDGLGGEIHLAPATSGWLEPARNPFGLYLYREDVDGLARLFEGEILGAGGPSDRAWGMYEFALNGPSGELVRIGWPSRLRGMSG